MWDRIKAWLIRQSDVYPPRWYWPIVRIYGGPDGQESRLVYMTRGLLTPELPTVRLFGRVVFEGRQYYLHVFHRADVDRDPHDHPFDFWTFPINKGYIEEVYQHSDAHAARRAGPCFEEQTVPARRWSFRPATHTHRVDRTTDGRWPLVTLVRRSTNKRLWGFWCHDNSYRVPGMPPTRYRRFVPWKNYVYEGQHANEAGEDVMCPGGLRRKPEGPSNA